MSTRTYLALAAAGVLTLGLSGSAFAFHDGGVAHCDGCHSMHNSADNPVSGAENEQLLKGSDPSSTCLNCHNGGGGYHVLSSDGSNVGQGGDFFWIKTDYTYPERGSTKTSLKENHGHSIVALDFGLTADPDPDNATAPGGSYPAASLGCASCHNPHGSGDHGAAISGSGSYYPYEAPIDGSVLGDYRFLGNAGYVPTGVLAPFAADAPVALALNNISRGDSVDYGSGMSAWCTNCHTTFGTGHKHPVDETLPGALQTNYNQYKATGQYGMVDSTNSYDSLVPFERGAPSSVATLDPNSTAGVDADSVVMCLTCHRAHASAFDNAGRWDFKSEFLAESKPLTSADAGIATAISVYYKNGATIDLPAVYGEWQRSLCNKCHGWD